MQEKIELSLERRHVAILASCVLVLVGGIFALGVSVGRQLASRALAAPRPAPAGDLAALDLVREERPGGARAPLAAASDPAAPAAAKSPAPPVENKPPSPASKGIAIIAPSQAAVVPAPPPARTLPFSPPPRELGAFTVQLGASQDPADARRLESRARAAGLHPYVAQIDLGRKGLWYRVRVGAFATREGAVRFRNDVERETRTPAVVMSSR